MRVKLMPGVGKRAERELVKCPVCGRVSAEVVCSRWRCMSSAKVGMETRFFCPARGVVLDGELVPTAMPGGMLRKASQT